MGARFASRVGTRIDADELEASASSLDRDRLVSQQDDGGNPREGVSVDALGEGVAAVGEVVVPEDDVAALETVEEMLELGQCFVVLGNHDFADSRDPFSQRIDPAAIAALEGVVLLGDESVELELRGRRVQVVGVDPRTYAARRARPEQFVDESVALRVLLCHFPGIVRHIPPVFQLVLSGHLHAGQIVVPYPGGKLRLAHLRARDVEGVYDYGTTKLHVSPGLGTTFVPFRLFARPEVTELVLRAPS